MTQANDYGLSFLLLGGGTQAACLLHRRRSRLLQSNTNVSILPASCTACSASTR